MASNVTLLKMMTKARQHSDQVNSSFISRDELKGYINDACSDLYNILVESGELYSIKSQTIPLISNQDTYPLASDYYKLIGVDLMYTNVDSVSMKPFTFNERNAYKFQDGFADRRGNFYRYLLQGSDIKFLPIPTGGQSVRVWYAPTFVPLDLDTDTFDGINGWESYVELDAAIKMMIKEESDPSALMNERNKIETEIRRKSKTRNMESGGRIGDVTRDGMNFWNRGSFYE